MTKKTRNVVTPDKMEEALLEAALESQGNAIPAAVAAVLRIAGPILVRLAIRYLARKYRKKLTEQSVNTASQWAGEKLQGIIDRSGTK